MKKNSSRPFRGAAETRCNNHVLGVTKEDQPDYELECRQRRRDEGLSTLSNSQSKMPPSSLSRWLLTRTDALSSEGTRSSPPELCTGQRLALTNTSVDIEKNQARPYFANRRFTRSQNKTFQSISFATSRTEVSRFCLVALQIWAGTKITSDLTCIDAPFGGKIASTRPVKI